MRRGVINFINNTLRMQTAQIEGIAGEIANDVDRFQPFGLNTIPLSDSEVIVADIGSTDHRVIIATDDRRYRPTEGMTGDVMLYGINDTPNATHNDSTQRITLKANGDILIKCGNTRFLLTPSNTVEISTTTINIIGDVNITGSVTANGKVIDDSHTHSSVQPGSGTSGPVT